MTITLNGTTGITAPALTTTGNNVLGDATSDTTNIGNGTIVTTSSGNVGIGVANAGNKMALPNNSYIGFMDSSGGETGYIGMKSTNLMSYSDKFYTNSSGQVLVNGTSAQNADVRLSVTANNGGSIEVKSTTDFYPLLIYRNGNLYGTIYQSGTTTAYNTTSDYRLKDNVVPMTGALAVVGQLKPCTYTWKETGENGQGFIAHELQAVVPDCVTGEKDAVNEEGKPIYQGIDTSFLVATLAAAIQELKAELDTVKTELATLKGTA